MDAADALKQKGNQFFASGDATSAIECYRQAISSVVSCGEALVVSDSQEGSNAANGALAVLYSNLSHAYLSRQEPAQALQAAQAAVAHNPVMMKAWLRLAAALHASGRSFEAFVVVCQRLTGRNAKTPSAAAEVKQLLGSLEEEIAGAIHVSELHPAFSIVETTNGIKAVACSAVASEKKLFVEAQTTHPRLAAQLPAEEQQGAVSSAVLLLHFGRQLHQLQQEHLQTQQAAIGCSVPALSDWSVVRNLLAGAWPRRLDEVSCEHVESTRALLKANGLGSKGTTCQEAAEAEMDDLVHLTLICRYNCFHSGFFRCCALLNHSCAPNAAMKYVPRAQCVHMIAVSDVAAGDELTVKYLSDADFLEGVGRRRELLYHSWLFWCECSRCVADNTDGALCELKRCAACSGYVHCPTPARSAVAARDADIAHVSDPVTVSSRTCQACGAVCSWSAEDTLAIYAARDEATRMEGTVQELSIKLVSLQCQVARIVHDDHWIHRVLLYYYCISITRMTAQWFTGLQSHQLQPDDVAQAALRQFGAGPGGRDGGDALVCLRRLWQRIKGFYPCNEGWALHCAIARLAVLNLICSWHQQALPHDECLTLLAAHVPYIGQQERSVLHRVLLSCKATDKEAISQKSWKIIKKLFDSA